jgi:hypothetical protein
MKRIAGNYVRPLRGRLAAGTLFFKRCVTPSESSIHFKCTTTPADHHVQNKINNSKGFNYMIIMTPKESNIHNS